jgi:hypothetical protein
MYHEERVIDGILNWRGTPDGEFKPYGQRELTRILLNERSRDDDEAPLLERGRRT